MNLRTKFPFRVDSRPAVCLSNYGKTRKGNFVMSPEDVLKLCEIGKDRFLDALLPSDFEGWQTITTKSISDPLLDCAGVYVLIQGDKVFYVGQSENILKRLNQSSHRAKNNLIDAVIAYPISDRRQRLAAEQAFIRCFSPSDNRCSERNFYWIKRTIERRNIRYIYK